MEDNHSNQATSGGDLLPPWCIESFLRSDGNTRWKIAYGGRGSGKSWAFAAMCVLRAMVRPVRILCARELQNSIHDSVHALLCDQIKRMGVEHLFEITDREIRGRCGSQIYFKGLKGMRNDASSIRSLEGIDICWIEEAQMISQGSLETLVPTIRRKGSEIWLTLNPNLETDPVYQLIKNPPDNAIIRKVNWHDNPWFDETSLPAEREYKERVDPEGYRHVWQGEVREHSDSQILKGKYQIAPFEPRPEWGAPLQGADWGFSQDPTTLVRCYVYQNVLYIHREAYGVAVEIDKTPEMFDSVTDQYFDARSLVTRADSARPETISYMKRHGYPNIRAAEKWKGSVEDGIAFLRAFETIMIHPSCTHAKEEAALWSYKVDNRTQDVLPIVQDGNDHIWDAVRYALSPLIRKKNIGTGSFVVPTL